MSDEDNLHGWNHQQCYPCWFNKWGFDREPVRVRYSAGEPPKTCCFCGRPTISGIFIRVKPGHHLIPHCPDWQLDRNLAELPSPAPATPDPPTDQDRS